MNDRYHNSVPCVAWGVPLSIALHFQAFNQEQHFELKRQTVTGLYSSKLREIRHVVNCCALVVFMIDCISWVESVATGLPRVHKVGSF